MATGLLCAAGCLLCHPGACQGTICLYLTLPSSKSRDLGSSLTRYHLPVLPRLLYLSSSLSHLTPCWLDNVIVLLTFLLQNLLACFHSGSDSFSGDACEVKVAAPSLSPSAEAEYWRIRAMAQQVGIRNSALL